MSKKLLNEPDECVEQCLGGLVGANPRLSLNRQYRVVVDTVPETSGNRQVGVVSGGGSGHEPFPAGYVGSGMLTGAACGSVFASPPSSNVLYAIRAVADISPGGVLVLIPNYTGDILNFGLAVELARADGIKVESVVVGDDIAQCVTGGEDEQQATKVGRRGMAGILASMKVAGAAAGRGEELCQVKQAAITVGLDTATLALAVNGGTLPGATAPLFTLGAGEMELGVGVHGEAGIRRMELLTAAGAMGLCLRHLTSYLDLTTGSEVLVIVNNLGGLSQMEQWVCVGELLSQLASSGITAQRTYAAPLFTSMDMPGIQITLIRVRADVRSSYLAAFDETTTAPCWPGSRAAIPPASPHKPLRHASPPIHLPKGPRASKETCDRLRRCLSSITKRLEENESRLNQLDSGCGDGDCGTTLRNLAAAINTKSLSDDLNFEYPATLAAQIASIAASTMGGTSGAIYSLLLTHAADAITTLQPHHSLDTAPAWAVVWRKALLGVQKYSRARVGDRTLFDALEPALEAFQRDALVVVGEGTRRSALDSAVEAAIQGCQRTKNMTARAGRASYVEASRVTEEDAGAFAVTVWLQAIQSSISPN